MLTLRHLTKMVQGGGAVRYGTERGREREGSAPGGSGAKRVYIGLAAFGILAVAGVLVIVGGGSRGGMVGAVDLESSTRSHYLGDNTALSTEAARKQAETMFDSDKSKKRLHRKFYAQHRLKHGFSAEHARSDLSSFFDTLGLNGNAKKKHQTQVDVHSSLVKKNDNRKTVVNVYINADKAKKEEKEEAPKKVAVKPVEKKARKVQLATVSKYQREMAEARKLLGGSKIQKQLAQARTLSLKAEAPYYTG